jgi:hypothetical protein
MTKAKGIVAVVGLAVALAGAVVALRAARAQDGLPDLTGTWTGTSKGKALPFAPFAKAVPTQSTFTADVSPSGPDLAITLNNASDPPVDLTGLVGNGAFWAVSGDPAAPLLIVGHSDKSVTHLKGGILSGNDAAALDAKFKAGQ